MAYLGPHSKVVSGEREKWGGAREKEREREEEPGVLLLLRSRVGA